MVQLQEDYENQSIAAHATQQPPACELVGCKPESAFVPNSAGWSIYKRVPSDTDGGAPAASAMGAHKFSVHSICRCEGGRRRFP